MKYVYPVVFTQDSDGSYMACAPDLPGMVTCGRTIEEAVDMATDACEMWLWDAEKKKEVIPHASDLKSISIEEGQQVALILADTDAYRRRTDSHAVKKTLTIPAWMAYQAEEAGLGLSQLLQEAIRQRLNIQETLSSHP